MAWEVESTGKEDVLLDMDSLDGAMVLRCLYLLWALLRTSCATAAQ